MTPRETTGSDGYDRHDVESALSDILSSDQFTSSAQLSSFLKYIVTKKLDGEEDDIKAYSIAVDALGRSEDFDPQENAFVRVAAGRLRQVLALYNAGQSEASTPIRIVLQPGSYVPEFVFVEETGRELQEPITVLESVSDKNRESKNLEAAGDETRPLSAAADENLQVFRTQPLTFASKWWRLVVVGIGLAVLANLALALYTVLRPVSFPGAKTELKLEQPAPMDIGIRPRVKAFLVLPDKPYPDWLKLGELTESLAVVIARFDDYQFVGAEIVDGIDKVKSDPSVDYEVTLTAYRRDANVRFFGKMVNVKSKTTIWSTERLFEPPESLAGRNVPDIIGRIYAPVASPYGVLYANLTKEPDHRTGLSCVIAGYQYFYTKTSEKHATARACGEKMVERGTRLQSIYAMLAFLYLDEFRENRNRRERDPLQAAVKAAKQAVALGPQSARAHQALFATHKVQGHREPARKAAEKAIALNPYDTDIIGDYAAWLISIGDIKKGREYLTRVEGMLDARPAWLDFYRFLGAELSSEFQSANDISLMMDMKRAPLLAVAVAIGAHSRGDTEITKRALEELLRTEPGFRTDPMAQFINRGFDTIIAQQLIEKLNAAGLKEVTGG